MAELKPLSRDELVSQGLVLILVLSVFGAIYLLEPGYQEVLIYRRVAVEQGEVWRLLTAHLVHRDGVHFAFNAIGFMIIHLFWIIARIPAGQALLLLVVTALNISLLAHGYLTDIQSFLGMSALLHGNWLIAAWRLRSRFALEAFVLAVLLAMKLAWEQTVGQMPYSSLFSSGFIAVDGHLYGALGGLLTIILWQIWYSVRLR